jgi:hypothetical protein
LFKCLNRLIGPSIANWAILKEKRHSHPAKAATAPGLDHSRAINRAKTVNTGAATPLPPGYIRGSIAMPSLWR